jgi:type II secretory pathway predicted ATPase ExeA
VLTGKAGTGKSILIAHMLGGSDPEELQVLRLSPGADGNADVMEEIAAWLGTGAPAPGRANLVGAIERGLRARARTGKRTVVVVDTAHRLPIAALEDLRLVSSLEVAGHALTQIILLGEPELRDRLERADDLERLRGRIIAAHQLAPMEAREIPGYVAHRLMLVGWRGRPDFAEDAFPALHAETGGVPARVNLLAGRAMLHAAIAGTDLIDGAIVRAAAGDRPVTPDRDQPGPACEPVRTAGRPYRRS